MRKILISTFVLFSLTVFTAYGVRAWPGLFSGELENGNTINYRLIGDEFCHEYVSEDGYVLQPALNGKFALKEQFDNADFLARHRKAANKPARLINDNFPTIGNLKGIIILVEFADNSFIEGHDKELFSDIMNGERYSENGATGSARDYFMDQSSGLFIPDFDVYGPVKLSRNMAYYGKNDTYGQDSNPHQMVIEACKYLEEEENVDFSKYDFDEDGTIDFVYIIYAGYAESYGASSNTIWPHASNITVRGEYHNVSGKLLDKYACSSELKYVSGEVVEGIGTLCHEFSHVLGLPDMYDTNGISNQLGSWDVMDVGNYNNESHTPPSYSAFERSSLGWLELTELDTPADRIELPELTSSNFAYRVSTPVEDEFFTLENRQQVGWDAYQPGKGLMIIHVTYEPSAWTNNLVNSGSIRRYDLVEADGTQGNGHATDLFPNGSVDAFTDYTTPSSLTWNGTPTEKGITMIKDEDGLITFRFMKDRFAAPVIHDDIEIGSDYFKVSWDEVEDAQYYSMTIKEILPDEENPLLMKEDFSMMQGSEYPYSNSGDISSYLDDYMSERGWTGNEVYESNGCVMIGRYATSGKFVSPLMKSEADVETLTLGLSVISYPGKSVNYTVKILDVSGNVIESFSDKATKTQTDMIYKFDRPKNSFRVSIEAENERLFLDDFILAEGDYNGDEIKEIGPANRTIDNIETTYYRVDGLKPLHTYLFSLETMSANGMHKSLPTEEVAVTTSEEAGVQIISDKNQSVASVKYFNLLGQPVNENYKGVRIKVIGFSDGSTKRIREYNR